MKVLAHYRRALRYVRPYWPVAIGSIVATTGAVGVGLLAPWPMKILVDSVLGNESLPGPIRFVDLWAADKSALLVVVVATGFVIALISGALDVLTTYLNTKLEIAMMLDFRSDLFQQAQRLSMAFHDQRRSGMVIYIINSMTGSATSLVMTILPLGKNVLMLVGMFWISFRLNAVLALLSLSVVPFLYYSVGYYTTHIRQRLMAVKGMEGETLSIIHEAMSMLRVIVAFGREDYEHARFREQGQRALDARVRITVRQTVFSLAVNATTALGTAIVLGYGASLVLGNRLTVGELLIVVAYIGSVYKPLEAISGTIGGLQDQLVNLALALDLLDKQPDIVDTPDAVTIGRARGFVQFQGVGFNYHGRVDTLADISFDAVPGQAIAIVGATGAGKSTLVSLLPRFYDPITGRIVLDGVDIQSLTLRSLRDQISLVLQEPLLFSSSVIDNIRYGRLDASVADIVDAATAANAHEFIMNLPHGYETTIGERGAQLSGGERQRIAIARAFLKDAPILILDEPTSSIDSKTEAVILDSLERLMSGRTTFVVAHRLSTLRAVDLILVLDRGRIVERGTHDELLARRGLYRQLYDAQTGATRRRIQAALHQQPAALM
jgi:ATP-binding cassette subfamily B protein/subfamily B ATP-binding cassette protein MsbA